MSLQTNILQSLISRNRATLTSLHVIAKDNKEARDDYTLNDYYYQAECCHKRVVKSSKEIAKLSAVQKALKRELAEQIQTARDVRYMAKLRRSLAARLGEAKVIAMDAAGEVSPSEVF
jgi:hypothetical protein